DHSGLHVRSDRQLADRLLADTGKVADIVVTVVAQLASYFGNVFDAVVLGIGRAQTVSVGHQTGVWHRTLAANGGTFRARNPIDWVVAETGRVSKEIECFEVETVATGDRRLTRTDHHKVAENCGSNQ